ncbi:MAG: type II toxin-antitoxin system RelE/ParE family toxin [Gemmataceae bacterium]
MSRYRIANDAQADLRELYNYVARFSEARANALFDEFLTRFQVIADQPLLQGATDELYGTGLRVNALRGYLVFYRTTDAGVEIARVIDSARGPGAV